jgi:hypothetical protein
MCCTRYSCQILIKPKSEVRHPRCISQITKLYSRRLKSKHNCIMYININIYLIYKDECLFVCFYGTYTKPHIWTDLNQILHTSPPWSGGGRRVCTDPQYFNFPTFSMYFVGSEYRFVRRRWLPAPERYTPCWCDVTGVTCTVCNALTTRRSERNTCVCGNGNLMRREERKNKLHLKLHCIYTNDNEKPVYLSSVLLLYPVYGQHILSPHQPFPSF